MPHGHCHPVVMTQTLRQLLGQIHGAMLPAGAPKRHHQILETALLVTGQAGIYERQHAGEKLMHALLLVEIVDYRRVTASESLEAFFAPGIREAAAIEDEATAVPCFILRYALVKGKTENAH